MSFFQKQSGFAKIQVKSKTFNEGITALHYFEVIQITRVKCIHLFTQGFQVYSLGMQTHWGPNCNSAPAAVHHSLNPSQ